MREAEAQWIGRHLAGMPDDKLSPVANLGSADQQHRTVQAHATENIWAPLRARKIEVFHVDLKEGQGIDVVGDIYDERVRQQILARKPKTVLCCNMLEHVTRPNELAEICCRLGADTLIVSAPYSYPYHRDPIDTMFRPDLATMSRLFHPYRLLVGSIVSDSSMWGTLVRYHDFKWILSYLLKSMALFVPILIFRRKELKSRYHRFLWMTRPYMITCAVFVRNDDVNR